MKETFMAVAEINGRKEVLIEKDFVELRKKVRALIEKERISYPGANISVQGYIITGKIEI
jgi:hypothetical protein